MVGNVVNARSSTISTFTGGITNTGSLSSPLAGVLVGGLATEGGTVRLDTFSGGITNSGIIDAYGIIVGGTAGAGGSITISSFANGIDNSGHISATGPGEGIVVGGFEYSGGTIAISDFSGGITNSGSISAGALGIQVGGLASNGGSVKIDTFSGGITNSGTITAYRGIDVGGRSFDTTKPLITISTFSGGVTNGGTISSGYGILIGGTTPQAATISDFSGGISNSGTISAAGTAIAVTHDQTFSGGIIDTGIILGGNVGISIDNLSKISTTSTAVWVSGPTFTGGLVNAGALTTTNLTAAAILVGNVVNARSSTISTFTGGITNTGSLSSPLAGVLVGGLATEGGTVRLDTFSGGITNSGIIDAYGIIVGGTAGAGGSITISSFANGIDNSGHISATGPGEGIVVGGFEYSGGTIAISDFSGGITNSGSISAGALGIQVGGLASNGGSVKIDTFSGGITNSGTITAYRGIDVGGRSFDTTKPLITISTFSGGVTNSGTISSGYGILIGGTTPQAATISDFSGGITNSGTISATVAIELNRAPGISIFDSGIITATSGMAIQLNPSSGTDTLTLAAGYTITGDVVGGGSDTLQLGDSGAASFDFSLIGPGEQYTGFSTFDVTGGTWDTIGDGSNWVVERGALDVGGLVTDTTIDSSGTLGILSGGGASGSITFAGTGGALQIDGPNAAGNLLPGATLSGFTPGDTIDLTSIANVAGSHVDMNYTTDVLTVTEGAETYTLDFAGNFTGDFFHLSADNAGAGPGTLITENTTPCYCPGTLIRTPRGQKKIEKLKIGDKVMTMSGAARPIKWIGRRSYCGRFVMGRTDILPVCIKAGALDDHVPKRDLWISPNHAMFLDGMLIEAKDIVNGISIVQAESVDQVEYIHIELDSHDVIIAEGALSESFVDDDSRLLFHNTHEYRTLYQDAAVGPAQYCVPRVEDGYEVEAVRQRLELRAGLAANDEVPPVGNLRGFVDRITADSVTGWAQNLDHPEAPVCLDILVGGGLVGQVLANRYREDLERAGIGSGCHSFEFTMPSELVFAPDEVEVRRSLDGVALELTIEAWRMLRQDTSRGREARRAVA